MRRCDEDAAGDPLEIERLVERCRVRLRHPPAGQLERFLRGELGERARLAVVRHLLTGCPRCAEITRRLWSFGERVPREAGETRAGGRWSRRATVY
jgi:hypothetical protein